MKKIVFVGGGTLGHIFPMLPIVRKIKPDYELIFIGTTSGLEKALIQDNGLFDTEYYLDMQGFVRKLSLKNFTTLKKFLKCKKQAKKILKELKPSLVIGFGGYISGVVLIAATSLKIKTIIHEQNAVLGLANFLVYKKVDRLLLGFPLAKPLKGDNIKLLGNPRITEIYENNKNWTENEKLILVVGGSRGSQVINDCTIKAKDELVNKGYRIILVTGKKYFEENKNTIPASTDNFTIIPFTNHLIEFMRKASIIVSRSGATTLSEILGLRKISILIPSPNVTKNHQEKNADVLVNSGAAIKILERDLNPRKLIDNIEELTVNRLKRIKMIENMIKIAEISARDKFIKEMEMII